MCIFVNTMKPLWKGQECLTKVAKFGRFPCTILYKLCLFYPSWQATSFERPPSWMAFIEGFHCINSTRKLQQQYAKSCKFLMFSLQVKYMQVLTYKSFRNISIWKLYLIFKTFSFWEWFLVYTYPLLSLRTFSLKMGYLSDRYLS